MIDKATYLIQKNNNLIVWLLMATVVIAGTVYSIYLGDALRWADEEDYYAIGCNLATKHQFTINGINSTAYRPPGYPFLIFLFKVLGGGTFFLRLSNYLFLALCIFLLHRILHIHGHALAGVIAGFLVLEYPVLFYTAGTLYPQIFGSFLFLFVIFMFVRNVDWKKEILFSGFAFGFAILTIPSFLFIFPLMALHPWLLDLHNKWKRSALFVIICLCVISGWTLRNYIIFGHFVPVSSNSGRNLLAGNSENATANSGITTDISKYMIEAKKFGGNQILMDKYFTQKALEWVKNNKTQALTLYLKKSLNYFNFRNELATKTEASMIKNLIMLFTYGLFIILFMIRIGLLYYYKLSRLEFMFIIIYFFNIFPSAIFYTRIRYRLPFDFLLIALVAVFLDKVLIVRLQSKERTFPPRPSMCP
jgi:hypothetical protein